MLWVPGRAFGIRLRAHHVAVISNSTSGWEDRARRGISRRKGKVPAWLRSLAKSTRTSTRGRWPVYDDDIEPMEIRLETQNGLITCPRQGDMHVEYCVG